MHDSIASSKTQNGIPGELRGLAGNYVRTGEKLYVSAGRYFVGENVGKTTATGIIRWIRSAVRFYKITR